MRRALIIAISALFLASIFAQVAMAKKKDCDFHQWPMKHCKKPDKVVLTGINFSTGSSKVDPSSYNELDKNAFILKKHPELKFDIVGHTDDVGDNASNQRLSVARAKAVRDYLVYQGIDPARITIIGKGEDEPVVDNGSSEGRYQNRRIELIFH